MTADQQIVTAIMVVIALGVLRAMIPQEWLDRANHWLDEKVYPR